MVELTPSGLGTELRFYEQQGFKSDFNLFSKKFHAKSGQKNRLRKLETIEKHRKIVDFSVFCDFTEKCVFVTKMTLKRLKIDLEHRMRAL